MRSAGVKPTVKVYEVTYDACHEKQILMSLLLSYQKKGGRTWPHPSFFWHDTDFSRIYSMMSAETNSEKSVSYQKEDGRGHAHPSFFWYDNDKDLKFCFLVTHVMWVYISSRYFEGIPSKL